VIAAAGAEWDHVGLMPTLSWSAPSLGVPDRYVVTIRGGPDPRGVLLVTARTEVVLPPGVLRDGTTYFARVTALQGASNASAVVGNFVP
jgi:hypothetical protein